MWLYGLIILALAVAGLIAYLWFSGPALPAETDAIINEVLKSELPELVVGETGYALSGGLKIWYERIAPPGPSKGNVLLNIAMGSDALNWPPAFVRALGAAGYHVIRYDQRGTGLSDWVADWDRNRPYTLTDMAGDALAVLDALAVPAAHVIGLSMGGMVAQEVAIGQPARVLTLTLLMTSGHVVDPDLPGLTSRYFLSLLAKGLPLLKYGLMGGERNQIKMRLAKMRQVLEPEDLNVREIAQTVLYDLRRRRGMNMRAVLQHQAAVGSAGPRYEKLRTLPIPALVVHGIADDFIPVEHGRKLAATLPQASGVWLEGVGHLFPVPDMPALITRIVAHMDAAAGARQ